jgi:microcystin degradation protein MlrC
VSYRVAAAEISHETNVFSAVSTTYQSFIEAGLRVGDEAIDANWETNSSFGGFIQGSVRYGLQLLPLLSVWATPSGIVTAECMTEVISSLEDQLTVRMNEGPIDGVLLALHGAMVTDLDRDGDALILETVRRIVGRDCPVVATLDLHANISERMVAAADLLIGYDTYPHTDMAERAIEACWLIREIIEGAIRPVSALIKPPMMPTSQRMPTAHEPMQRLISLAHEAERQPGVVNVTIAGGFPPADVEEAGLSVLVTTDGNRKRADAIANDLARIAWEHRVEFLGGVFSFEEAAREIEAHPHNAKPLLIVDIADNPWSGGPGDSSELLRFLVEQRVTDAALAPIVDPEAVRHCQEAGVGQTVGLTLGGKTDALHGAPLTTKATVKMLSDGRYRNRGPMMTNVMVDLGVTARVEISGIDVLITSRAETPIDPQIFLSHGIEPARLRVIGLKGKGHFRAAFEPIVDRAVLVEGPGITGSDLSRLPFRHVRRPIWPLDQIEQWTP